MTTKRLPRVGDEIYCVEWQPESGVVYDECGDVDRDSCKTGWKNFRTLEEARVFAKQVYPQDVYGCVLIYHKEFVAYDESDAGRFPHAGFWEDMDEGECYDGEESANV